MEEKEVDQIKKIEFELSELQKKYNSLCKEHEIERMCLNGLHSENRDLKRNIETQFEVIKNLSIALANKK